MSVPPFTSARVLSVTSIINSHMVPSGGCRRKFKISKGAVAGKEKEGGRKNWKGERCGVQTEGGREGQRERRKEREGGREEHQLTNVDCGSQVVDVRYEDELLPFLQKLVQ